LIDRSHTAGDDGKLPKSEPGGIDTRIVEVRDRAQSFCRNTNVGPKATVPVVAEKGEFGANEAPAAATRVTLATGKYGGDYDHPPHPISSVFSGFDDGSAYLVTDCEGKGVPWGHGAEIKSEIRPTQAASCDLEDDFIPFRMLLPFLYVHRLARPPDDPR
jgi:hypothetical protein